MYQSDLLVTPNCSDYVVSGQEVRLSQFKYTQNAEAIYSATKSISVA